jgi:hypothetical protein
MASYGTERRGGEMALNDDDKGWALVGSSRKFHYYRGDSRSACGKYVALFVPDGAFTPHEDTFIQQSSDCATCWKKLNA